MKGNYHYTVIIASLIISSGIFLGAYVERPPRQKKVPRGIIRDAFWQAYREVKTLPDKDDLEIVFAKFNSDKSRIMIRVEYEPQGSYFGRDTTDNIILRDNGYGLYTGSFLENEIEVTF